MTSDVVTTERVGAAMVVRIDDDAVGVLLDGFERDAV